ncbi:uncharacterized protein LOC133185624 [Saccostrea echinata]|uniref:uncharacterized protein LOC133185624 n=1 Tax=Saccostrea echinata TaxID=191078 RepID=UPI002A828B6C|nr:uncharacterized protein LOC133185624 [Saccostrea echinata]
MEKPMRRYTPTDVILEIEGRDIHVNKQVLADNSPVFKAMFESNFSEKHKGRIVLSDKKYDDFVIFLNTFYNPELSEPITEKNATVVERLADFYGMAFMKENCLSFINDQIKNAVMNSNYKIRPETLVDYMAWIEQQDIDEQQDSESSFSSLLGLCSECSTQSLKQAGICSKVSVDTQLKIAEKRITLMEKEIRSTLHQGEKNILELMKLAWETWKKICEDRLVSICNKISDKFGKFTTTTLVDYIIAAERYNLETLLSNAIDIASKCKPSDLLKEEKFCQIKDSTKSKINEKRNELFEEHVSSCHHGRFFTHLR